MTTALILFGLAAAGGLLLVYLRLTQRCPCHWRWSTALSLQLASCS